MELQVINFTIDKHIKHVKSAFLRRLAYRFHAGGLRVLRDYREKENCLDDHSFMPDNMEDGNVSFFPAEEA